MQYECAILSSVACPPPPYSSTLSHTSYDFQKKVIEHKMCVLIFSMTFVWNISNFKKNSVRYYHKYSQIFHVKYRWKDRQTDRTKLIFTFCNSANVPISYTHKQEENITFIGTENNTFSTAVLVKERDTFTGFLFPRQCLQVSWVGQCTHDIHNSAAELTQALVLLNPLLQLHLHSQYRVLMEILEAARCLHPQAGTLA